MNEVICDCNVIHEDIVNNVKTLMPQVNLIYKISDFFKIVGDLTRLKIVYALDSHEMCVCDIANLLNMTKSSISHQLATLKERGLVKGRKVGKEVYYTLDDEHVREVFEVAMEHCLHKEREENEKISI